MEDHNYYSNRSSSSSHNLRPFGKRDYKEQSSTSSGDSYDYFEVEKKIRMEKKHDSTDSDSLTICSGSTTNTPAQTNEQPHATNTETLSPHANEPPDTANTNTPSPQDNEQPDASNVNIHYY